MTFSYEILNKETSELVKKGNLEMNFTNKEWLSWDNQLLLQYYYDTIGDGKIDSSLSSQTGYRKDINHLYIHPPRSYGLEIVQYAPFPVIYFNETKNSWKDTFDIPMNSGWGQDLDNTIFFQEYHVVLRSKNEINIEASSIRDKDTSVINYVYDFEKGFQKIEYDILDSLIINIKKNSL